MPETPAFLAERLKVEGDKTLAFFTSLRPEQWKAMVYTEGETWTIRNVLAHFVTAEKGFLTLFADIRNGGPGAAEDFDIDRYNASQQRRAQEISYVELLEQFKVVRAKMIAMVTGFTDDDLSKIGRHPFLGKTTLAEMIKMIYRHNQIHYRDIRKVMGDG